MQYLVSFVFHVAYTPVLAANICSSFKEERRAPTSLPHHHHHHHHHYLTFPTLSLFLPFFILHLPSFQFILLSYILLLICICHTVKHVNLNHFQPLSSPNTTPRPLCLDLPSSSHSLSHQSFGRYIHTPCSKVLTVLYAALSVSRLTTSAARR